VEQLTNYEWKVEKVTERSYGHQNWEIGFSIATFFPPVIKNSLFLEFMTSSLEQCHP
jgi:hypothetical protein